MVQGQDLYAIGTEYSELKFDGFWDWLVQVSDINHHWKYQPTYVIVQFVFLFGGLATLLHAIKSGGRLPFLWLTIVLHGFFVEFMCYIMPDIDNFWHSQTPVMFLGRRLPLHILTLYPHFLYNASIAMAKLKLPRWAEPFAVGLCVVMTDLPYDIVSVNYLHWTWHDTDPNIYDRHYWVPWNSYYFHACFAAGLTFWFHFSRKLFCKTEKWEADRLPKELLCCIITGFLAAPTGILLFLPNYHPLHDIFKIHSEVTFFILVAVFLVIIITALLGAREISKPSKPKTHIGTFLVFSAMLIHYTSFLLILFVFKPENEVAIGLKEPIGPCNEYVPIHTAFGMTLQKRKYLCATDYDEKYFDFHCLPREEPPKHGASWYTACGVALPNQAEYIAIIGIIWLLGVAFYTNFHFRTGGEDVFKVNAKSVKQKTK